MTRFDRPRPPEAITCWHCMGTGVPTTPHVVVYKSYRWLESDTCNRCLGKGWRYPESIAREEREAAERKRALAYFAEQPNERRKKPA